MPPRVIYSYITKRYAVDIDEFWSDATKAAGDGVVLSNITFSVRAQAAPFPRSKLIPATELERLHHRRLPPFRLPHPLFGHRPLHGHHDRRRLPLGGEQRRHVRLRELVRPRRVPQVGHRQWLRRDDDELHPARRVCLPHRTERQPGLWFRDQLAHPHPVSSSRPFSMRMPLTLMNGIQDHPDDVLPWLAPDLASGQE